MCLHFPEDGGSGFLLNIRNHLPHYKTYGITSQYTLILANAQFLRSYFTKLSISIERRVVEWLMNDELERLWKKAVIT
jgi:hypothetical protein